MTLYTLSIYSSDENPFRDTHYILTCFCIFFYFHINNKEKSLKKSFYFNPHSGPAKTFFAVSQGQTKLICAKLIKREIRGFAKMKIIKLIKYEHNQLTL